MMLAWEGRCFNVYIEVILVLRYRGIICPSPLVSLVLVQS